VRRERIAKHYGCGSRNRWREYCSHLPQLGGVTLTLASGNCVYETFAKQDPEQFTTDVNRLKKLLEELPK
jgi:hypothetical protein